MPDGKPAAGDPPPSRGMGRVADALARSSSRRGFLSRLGQGLVLAAGGGVLARAIKPGDAEAFHFCGHTFTTGSCVHPLGLPRIDNHGMPIRASDGKPIDNLGRLINDHGQPIGARGSLLMDPDGRPLPPAPRTRICDETGRIYGFDGVLQGAWYRCCEGNVRKLWDCCAHSAVRINGDAALHGYCYGSRNVFCVTYYQTHVPC
jgi:hypothetical protein